MNLDLSEWIVSLLLRNQSYIFDGSVITILSSIVEVFAIPMKLESSANFMHESLVTLFVQIH